MNANYRRKRRILLVVFVLLILLVVLTQSGWLGKTAKTAETSQPGLYPVNRFVDGDTIVVDMNGTNETVRFIGVDTPETHKPNTPVQCFGPQAAAYTKKLIGVSRVRLQADPLDTNRDRYGRLLRYIYMPNGTLVEDRLISNGYGFAYTIFPFEKIEQFKKDQSEAQSAHQGLWSACQPHLEPSGVWQNNAA